MHAKDLSDSKCEYLIRNCENVGIKHLNDLKTFTECSNTMNGVMKKLIIIIQTEIEKY